VEVARAERVLGAQRGIDRTHLQDALLDYPRLRNIPGIEVRAVEEDSCAGGRLRSLLEFGPWLWSGRGWPRAGHVMHLPCSIRYSRDIRVLVEHRVIRGEGASGDRKNQDGSPRGGANGRAWHTTKESTLQAIRTPRLQCSDSYRSTCCLGCIGEHSDP